MEEDPAGLIPLDRNVAESLGLIATICFFVQYIPQMWLNFKRSSTRGFSSLGIIIKLVGACFLFVNAWVIGETVSVVLYGFSNVLQHSVFMLQFWLYYGATESIDKAQASDTPAGKSQTSHVSLAAGSSALPGSFVGPARLGPEWFLYWLLFPIVPYLLARFAPASIAITNSVKPISQVMSHLPQLRVCYQLRTTSGVSMLSQHLNILGGVAGLVMCLVIRPKSIATYLIYANSIAQAVSLYAMFVYYSLVRNHWTRSRAVASSSR